MWYNRESSWKKEKEQPDRRERRSAWKHFLAVVGASSWISLPDLDIFIRGREHFSLCGNLHGPRFTEDREFIPGLPRYRRPVRRLPGYDICRGERSPRLLGIRAAILRHLDRLRRYVQHCLYFESLRDLSRSLHTHKGSSQIRSLGDEKGRRCWDRCSVVARRTHILRPHQPRPSPCKWTCCSWR